MSKYVRKISANILAITSSVDSDIVSSQAYFDLIGNSSVSWSCLDNIFALPAEVFSSCLAIVSAVMVGGLFLWLALRYGTGYQIVERSGHQQTRSLKTFLFSGYSCT